MLRFDPFSDMDAWARGMLTGSAAGTARTPKFMPLDLYKVDDHYMLVADLPGADPGSIDVSVDNGVLTLSAQRSAPSDEGVQWLASERFSGTYRRQVTLGDSIDSAGISARYDNGVLTVTIPVAEKAKPRRIEVESINRQQEIETGTVT
ncbi:Hsp20/alpha crystallin family protein [Gordonia rubripertincta]|uniref:Hsp20/alpha crystallin family protein n=2 Tax=Gordonia rubripertincta TaxID=36822 RepID=A0AAW4G3P7_GORRU|nr:MULTISPECIES: Hsp20/alpha crystallin family protein [Gordonia]ASR01851.1 18 kDa heat shock protein [Gordonia rubripertincta]MBM7277771.1 Hsp20/alpha crystallin family protein [Gordonia rubripertincta]MDG6782618.1 Hsp20/alpha crystallin family protein [Gordonia rubripertincta]NKY62119.1 Hsp20/alpha crystallin family protein [Gordonia rubripertincta]QMU22764.1 Hsp20/alpha crystallin family protein [Gordonia rubripertincta]